MVHWVCRHRSNIPCIFSGRTLSNNWQILHVQAQSFCSQGVSDLRVLADQSFLLKKKHEAKFTCCFNEEEEDNVL